MTRAGGSTLACRAGACARCPRGRTASSRRAWRWPPRPFACGRRAGARCPAAPSAAWRARRRFRRGGRGAAGACRGPARARRGGCPCRGWRRRSRPRTPRLMEEERQDEATVRSTLQAGCRAGRGVPRPAWISGRCAARTACFSLRGVGLSPSSCLGRAGGDPRVGWVTQVTGLACALVLAAGGGRRGAAPAGAAQVCWMRRTLPPVTFSRDPRERRRSSVERSTDFSAPPMRVSRQGFPGNMFLRAPGAVLPLVLSRAGRQRRLLLKACSRHVAGGRYDKYD